MHQPVLTNEVIDLLAIKRGGVYVDGTLGSGGHSMALLRELGGEGFVLGIDRDARAVERAGSRLSRWQGRFVAVHGNYADMVGIARSRGIDRVNGVLLDLGASSEQFDSPERGFSFAAEGPLDMRMDQSHGTTVAEMVNTYSGPELVTVLREFGEEPRAGRIVRRILQRRRQARINTTTELADLVAGALGGRRGARLHPATRTFQALRIAVNRELEDLQQGLPAGLSLLANGGRLAVISFHSLEDRLVKTFLRRHAGRWESLPAGGREWRGDEPRVALVNRKIVRPSGEEVQSNPRSRSARLRVAERL